MKTRVAVVVGVVLGLAGHPAGLCADSSDTRARLDVKALEKAVLFYNTQHGRWPDSLEALAQPQTDGSGAYLSPEALTDPWGRPYHYDPDSLHPDTGIPQIWSDGSDPANPRRKIANWPPSPPPTFWEVATGNVFVWVAVLTAVPALLVLGYAGVRYRRDGKIDAWVFPLVMFLGFVLVMGLVLAWQYSNVLM